MRLPTLHVICSVCVTAAGQAGTGGGVYMTAGGPGQQPQLVLLPPAMMAQQMAARAQLDQMRQQGLPKAEPGSGMRPGTYL